MLQRRSTLGFLLSLAALWACSNDDADRDNSSQDDAGTGGDESDAAVEEDSGTGVKTIDGVPALPLDVALPIVFVHGYAGSAQQYQSQAMRFEANGYPVGRIRAYEHHGGMSGEDFVAGLSAFVDDALEEFEVDKVYLVGHSRGTFVSGTYLENSDNAKKIAKYISLDGRGCSSAMSAGVPCIEPNQGSLPGQSHVEVATSLESFIEQYKFLIGEEPKITELTKQSEPVVISGRAVNFPENTGRADTTLEIWEIDSKTGQRATEEPLATYEIAEDGNWGPVTVDPDKHYEMVLLAPQGNQHHHYMQPFLRSTPFVRLLSGPPDTATRQNTNTGAGHAAAILMRMREWQTSDQLEVSTTTENGSEPPVNVITEGVGVDPSGGTDLGSLVRGRVGIHLHDDAETPGESTLTQLPWFSTQPFQTGVDVYMPAADPPTGTITFKSIPRGDTSRPQILNTPNWPSDGHLMTLLFADYAQD